MQLIIITGLPGTGKTTLGEKISKKLQIPFYSKDTFKELMFDDYGYKDREWSKKIGKSSYSIFYNIIEQNLKVNNRIIVESNFYPGISDLKFLEIKNKFNFIPFQIRCITDGKILFKRFKQRANFEKRHPGHRDKQSFDEWKPILLKGKIESLNIGGTLYDLDTTDFEKIDYDELYKKINLKGNHALHKQNNPIPKQKIS